MDNNTKEKLKKENYFTAGELASMYGVSKQSLLYYDRIHLLSPDFIAENGYRHYSIQQYLDLEIIVNLRKLDIPIKDIKEYLANRSQAKLLEITARRDRECAAAIRENQRIRDAIATIRSNLEVEREKQEFLMGHFTLQWRGEQHLQLQMVQDLESDKERITLFATASRQNMHKRSVLEKKCGWIIGREDFFENGRPTLSRGFYTLTGNLCGHDSITKKVLPAGMYCEICFTGTYYENAEDLVRRLKKFLAANGMVPSSDVYILPIANHWFTENTDDYVTKLFLQVAMADAEE